MDIGDKKLTEWMTIEESAKYLKVSIPTLRKYIASGDIPAAKRGRIIRLKKEDLDNFLKPIQKGE